MYQIAIPAKLRIPLSPFVCPDHSSVLTIPLLEYNLAIAYPITKAIVGY